MRPIVLFSVAAAVVCAWWFFPSPGTRSVQAAGPARFTYLIRFGIDGRENVDWSGSIAGGPVELAGWQFDPKTDQISGTSWKCATRRQTYWDTPYERVMGPTSQREKITAKGIRVEGAGPVLDLRVSTAQGDFVLDPNLAVGDPPRLLLNGRVSVQALPSAQQVTHDSAVEDFPSMVESRDGTLWLAYQTYSRDRDQVFVRKLAGGTWSAPIAVSEPGDCYRTAIAEDKAGRIWVVWSEQRAANFDLYGRSFDGRRWSAIERITTAPNSDMNHVLASNAAGTVYLAWQSARAGNFDIYLRELRDGKWGPEMQVSSDPANDWNPALAVGKNGAVTIVWDTYSRGNYDLVARTFFQEKFGAQFDLAMSPGFEARPSAQFDPEGKLWVAYDEGDVNWGKDYGYQIGDRGRGLLVKRQVRIGIFEGGRMLQPEAPVEAAIPEDLRQVFHQPQLVLDSNGNPTLFFRVRVNLPQERGGERYRALWRLYATTLRGGAWSPVMELPAGYGRIDMESAVVVRRNGEIAIAWAADGREWPVGHPKDQDLLFASIPRPASPTAPRLGAFFGMRERAATIHTNEAADVQRVRAYRAAMNGKKWRIVRGDVHRHTDISWDGNRDGSLDDSYRYALDAVAFDYLGVCDHQAGQSIPYNWWRIQKAVDLYTIAGRFAPVYSYERSLPWPNGHRNVVFAERGRPLLEISAAEQSGAEGAAKLYVYLKKFAGITMSHTSASGMGTDWRDNDPEAEPVVELYQGYRSNFEAPGAPRAPTANESSRFSAGFVAKAWEKGIKIGVQASSDHVSTHISYANFYVDAVDRNAILAAIRARRAFASTDNIVMDLRMGDHFMGESFSAPAPPALNAVVVGTGPLKQVDVIRNNKVVYTAPGSGSEVRFNFTDREKAQGEVFYYLRAEQQDGQLGWSSPVWVRYP